MNIFFDIVWSKEFVVTFSVSIILIGIFWLTRFYFSLKPIKNHLKMMIQKLKQTKDELDFKERYHELSDLFSKDKVLSHSWYEFSECLLVDETNIKNTRRAADYFSRDTLFYGHLNLSFYEAVPNILTGFGILGTFVGLLGGVSQVDVQNISSIEILLDGASFAFSTSIAGLISSIIFTLVKKRLVYSTDMQIQIWVENLDKRLEWISPEKLTYLNYTSQKKQIDILETLPDKFGLQISLSLKEMMVEQRESMKMITQEIIKRPFEILGDKIDDGNKSLVTAIEKMQTVLEETQDKIVEISNESMIKALEIVIRDFNVKLNEQFGDNFKRLNEAVGNMLEWQNNYRQFIDELHEFLPEQLRYLKNSTTTLDNASSAIDKIATIVDEMPPALREIHGNLKELSVTSSDIENQVFNMKKETAKLDSFLKSIAVIGNEAQNVLPSVSKHVTSCTKELNDAVGQMKNDWIEIGISLSDDTKSIITKIKDTNAEHSKYIAKTTEQIESHMENILNDSLAQFAGMLVALSKKFADDYEPLTEKLKKVVAIAEKVN